MSKGPGCSVGIALDRLPDAEGVALDTMLRSDPKVLGGWKSSAISKALKGSKFEIKGCTIARHRREECSCESR